MISIIINIIIIIIVITLWPLANDMTPRIKYNIHIIYYAIHNNYEYRGRLTNEMMCVWSSFSIGRFVRI